MIIAQKFSDHLHIQKMRTKNKVALAVELSGLVFSMEHYVNRPLYTRYYDFHD